MDQKGPLEMNTRGLLVTGNPGELTLLSALPELSQSLGAQGAGAPGCLSIWEGDWACTLLWLSPYSKPPPEVFAHS